MPILLLSSCFSSGLESQVSGKVSLDGQGIGPGSIVFVPESGAQSNPAVGAIQINGNYFLKTSRDIGLSPGNYKVSVTVLDQPTNIKPGERSMIEAKLKTPEKYVSADTSGLKYEVKSGSNTVNIELKSK
jgi:hypothetical protein